LKILDKLNFDFDFLSLSPSKDSFSCLGDDLKSVDSLSCFLVEDLKFVDFERKR